LFQQLLPELFSAKTPAPLQRLEFFLGLFQPSPLQVLGEDPPPRDAVLGNAPLP